MRKNLRLQADGDTHCALEEEEREFHGERDGLLVPSVVRERPVGGFRIEHHIESELRQPRLNITRSSSAIARKDIPPVTLTVYKEVFLSKLDEGVTY